MSPLPASQSPLMPDTRRHAWHIDQQTMAQGMHPAVKEKKQTIASRAGEWWQKATNFSAQQPVMTAVSDTHCAQIVAATARLLAVADQLVVIGTGGASLGAQTLCAFAEDRSRVLFLENCDASSAEQIFKRCNPKCTAWLIISKSGETVETLAASLALIAFYERVGVELSPRVLIMTSPGTRPLRALAEHCQWQVIDHPEHLGGRYSVFSAVGLIPAQFAGLSCQTITQAAAAAWSEALEQRDPLIFEAASWFAASLGVQPLHVVMGYSDRLRPYTQWYKQLWAESLGKNGNGPTPITAIGSVDQHSQLQLYLDGARDKLFTLLLPDDTTSSVPLAKVDLPGISYLSQHGMRDIMHASAEATCATLQGHGLPVRVFRGAFTAESIAQLMARTMVETLLTAAILEVDPFSQPAVEEGKQRARATLGYASAL